MPAIDDLQNGPTSSAAGAAAISPSDTTNLARVTRGVYIGGSGNVSSLMADGSTVVFVGAQSGSVLPIRVQRINAAGTTATNLLALY